jgi:hypothetical protein
MSHSCGDLQVHPGDCLGAFVVDLAHFLVRNACHQFSAFQSGRCDALNEPVLEMRNTTSKWNTNITPKGKI